MQLAGLADELSGRHGGAAGKWLLWLRQRGVDGRLGRAQLPAVQRAALQQALAAGLPPFAGHAEAEPAAPADLHLWARQSLLDFAARHRPWLLADRDGAEDRRQADVRQFVAAGASLAAAVPLPLPERDPLIVALRASGQPCDEAGLRVWALLEIAARNHWVAQTLAHLQWIGVPNAAPLRLLADIAAPGSAGLLHLPPKRVERVKSRHGELVRLRGRDPDPLPPASGQLARAPTAQTGAILQRLAPLPADRIALELGETTEKAVREVALRWQFRGAAALGSAGLIALFCGQRGNGRRTAARELAEHLQLPLLRVHAGLLASRWIGETEARISHMFRTAAEERAALLVEDANDLFSRHVPSDGANDRYANAVRNHLLQEIENFPGLVLLIAGGPHQFDSAMQRRMHTIVRFDHPGRPRRARILQAAWQWVVRRSPALQPAHAPDFHLAAAADLNPDRLVRAVLDAAMQALYAGRPLDDDALLSALGRPGDGGYAPSAT